MADLHAFMQSLAAQQFQAQRSAAAPAAQPASVPMAMPVAFGDQGQALAYYAAFMMHQQQQQQQRRLMEQQQVRVWHWASLPVCASRPTGGQALLSRLADSLTVLVLSLCGPCVQASASPAAAARAAGVTPGGEVAEQPRGQPSPQTQRGSTGSSDKGGALMLLGCVCAAAGCCAQGLSRAAAIKCCVCALLLRLLCFGQISIGHHTNTFVSRAPLHGVRAQALHQAVSLLWFAVYHRRGIKLQPGCSVGSGPCIRPVLRAGQPAASCVSVVVQQCHACDRFGSGSISDSCCLFGLEAGLLRCITLLSSSVIQPARPGCAGRRSTRRTRRRATRQRIRRRRRAGAAAWRSAPRKRTGAGSVRAQGYPRAGRMLLCSGRLRPAPCVSSRHCVPQSAFCPDLVGECRAAQRRFRERQKCLITDLKVRAETLQKENEAQRRRIAELEKENSVRRPAQVWRSTARAAWTSRPLAQSQAVEPCRTVRIGQAGRMRWLL